MTTEIVPAQGTRPQDVDQIIMSRADYEQLGRPAGGCARNVE